MNNLHGKRASTVDLSNPDAIIGDMKQTIQPMQNGRGIQFTTSNSYVVSIGYGPGHYCENYNAAMDGSENVPTSTMEVAIMDDRSECGHYGEFVCLPYDVAPNVPVSVMGDIILAVERNDWARVCFLCKQSDEDESKFPKKV